MNLGQFIQQLKACRTSTYNRYIKNLFIFQYDFVNTKYCFFNKKTFKLFWLSIELSLAVPNHHRTHNDPKAKRYQ